MYNLEAIQESEIDKEEDLVTGGDGFYLVMDIFSKDYLKGTTIDYVSSLNENGFKFINNAVKKSCRLRFII